MCRQMLDHRSPQFQELAHRVLSGIRGLELAGVPHDVGGVDAALSYLTQGDRDSEVRTTERLLATKRDLREPFRTSFYLIGEPYFN
jgi:hypothetical protein